MQIIAKRNTALTKNSVTINMTLNTEEAATLMTALCVYATSGNPHLTSMICLAISIHPPIQKIREMLSHEKLECSPIIVDIICNLVTAVNETKQKQ